MVTDAERTRLRARVFVDQVLEPAVHRSRTPLDVAIWPCTDRASLAEALAAERAGSFEEVALGHRFGPVWSSAWFRLRAELPESLADAAVALRFSCATEAVLWRGSVPVHGLDPNRDLVRLGALGGAGTRVELFVEAHVNHPLGVATFWWDPPEVHARWKESEPGRLERAELCEVDDTLFELVEAYRLAADLVVELGDASPRANRLRLALERARAQIDPARPEDGALAALAIVREALERGTAPSATACFAVGHAHLDTAWLWTFDRTREKAVRTYANAVALLDRRPDLRFLASQPQQLAWLEQDAPQLFARVEALVADGSVEPLGATWIEPDGNMPSGESLCRQLAYGTLWQRDRFGPASANRMLWLPDTFGFAASWPQLARLAGLDVFVTNKLWWSEREDFPHCHFRWRGLDGTTVLAHVTPGQDYNATNTAAELRRGERVLAKHDRVDVGMWLQPFGYGDGGGGPTEAQVLRAELAADCEGLPRARLDGARAFCDAFAARAELLEARGEPLPVWDGELYLENHRGVLTTQAALKRGNARSEQWLRGLEASLATWPIGLADDERERLLGNLRADWATVLLHQFHDVLPGSCTSDVAAEARAAYERLDAGWMRLARGLSERIARVLDTQGLRRPALAINLSSETRSGWFGEPRDGAWAEDVPPLGFVVVDRDDPVPHPRPVASFAATGEPAIEARGPRGATRVVLDAAGGVRSLEFDGRELVPDGRSLGELVLLDDRPLQWEAWNVDAEALLRAERVATGGEWCELDLGPARTGFESERALGERSSVSTRVWCEAGSENVHVDLAIDWREERRWLRALFPTVVRARTATCEVPFGHVERAATRNDATERAAFEAPIHRFQDASEPGLGLAVVNDCKYGGSVLATDDGVELGVSLLRATGWPDASADRTEAERGVRHRVRFTLVPHHGNWRRAGVLRLAEVAPLGWTCMPLPEGRGGPGPLRYAPVRVEVVEGSGPILAQLAAVAPSWSGDALLVRLVERAGARGAVRVRFAFPAEHVAAVDLLERPRPEDGVTFEDGVAHVPLRPFQVVTLRVSRDAVVEPFG
ncbi:MAG: glycoside hydrolase family 38 C-terminal domain-containing protein [Planctomycetota bacterium]